MGINNPIIDSGPTSPRSRNKQLYVRQSATIPPEPYREPAADGSGGVDVTQEPERVGQICHYRPYNAPAGNRSTTMYVVVDVDGVLLWKPVKTGVRYYDSATGQPWNPLANLPGYL